MPDSSSFHDDADLDALFERNGLTFASDDPAARDPDDLDDADAASDREPDDASWDDEDDDDGADDDPEYVDGDDDDDEPEEDDEVVQLRAQNTQYQEQLGVFSQLAQALQQAQVKQQQEQAASEFREKLLSLPPHEAAALREQVLTAYAQRLEVALQGVHQQQVQGQTLEAERYSHGIILEHVKSEYDLGDVEMMALENCVNPEIFKATLQRILRSREQSTSQRRVQAREARQARGADGRFVSRQQAGRASRSHRMTADQGLDALVDSLFG